MYYKGAPWAHGQAFGIDGKSTTWGTNFGIAAVRYRVDGFVSVSASPSFAVSNPAGWPGFTTVVMPLPTGCSETKFNHTDRTACSYQLPHGVCGGDTPHALRCSSTEDCRRIDNGTCNGVRAQCNNSGV